MPLPVLPGVVRCSLGGHVDGGGRWNNTWHARRIDLGDPTLVSVTALHVEFVAFYTAAVLGQMPFGSTWDSANYTPLDGTSGAITLPVNLAGLLGGTAYPPEVAEVLTLRTADRGRRARGRIFLPSFSEPSWDAHGLLADGTIANVLAGSAAFMAAAVVSGWQIGVASYGVSRKVDHTVRPARVVETTWSPFFTPLTLITMDKEADVIRGRKR